MKTRHLIPVLLAIGCGTVNPALVDGNNGSGADAPAGAVTITGMTPADGATKVGVLSKVTVQLSGDADASSVTRQTATLAWGDSKRLIASTVTYDATAHTITITPAAALDTGTTYKISIDGVTAGGTAIAATSAHFLTVYNPAKSYASLDATGKKTSTTDYGYNADGSAAWWANMAAGSDGLFGTADDVRTSYVAWSYPKANVARRIYMTGAGPDGLWGTSDDLYTGYVDITNGAAGMISDDTFTLGPDGKIDTADDVGTQFYHSAYDTTDRLLLVTLGTDGADGKFGTADDVLGTEDRYTYAGSVYDELDYSGPGPDGVWHTADDKITGYNQIQLDANGNVASLWFKGVGPDGVPATADDTTTGVWTFPRDSRGLQTQTVIHTGVGADGAWNTADDTIGSYYQDAYDADGNLTEYSGWSVGADGKAFTSDDYKNYSEPHDPTL
jgi:hypothetical protein